MVKLTSLLFLLPAAALPLTSPLPAQAPAHTQAAPQPLKLFVLLYRPGPNWIDGRPMSQQDLRPHGSYIAGLTQAGRVFAGGGFVNRDGGLAIVRAADMEDARAMLEADPAITMGVFAAEVHEWSPRFYSGGPLMNQPK